MNAEALTALMLTLAVGPRAGTSRRVVARTVGPLLAEALGMAAPLRLTMLADLLGVSRQALWERSPEGRLKGPPRITRPKRVPRVRGAGSTDGKSWVG